MTPPPKPKGGQIRGNIHNRTDSLPADLKLEVGSDRTYAGKEFAGDLLKVLETWQEGRVQHRTGLRIQAVL